MSASAACGRLGRVCPLKTITVTTGFVASIPRLLAITRDSWQSLADGTTLCQDAFWWRLLGRLDASKPWATALHHAHEVTSSSPLATIRSTYNLNSYACERLTVSARSLCGHRRCFWRAPMDVTSWVFTNSRDRKRLARREARGEQCTTVCDTVGLLIMGGP